MAIIATGPWTLESSSLFFVGQVAQRPVLTPNWVLSPRTLLPGAVLPAQGCSSHHPSSVKPVLSLLIRLPQSSLLAVMTKELKIAQVLQTLLETAWHKVVPVTHGPVWASRPSTALCPPGPGVSSSVQHQDDSASSQHFGCLNWMTTRKLAWWEVPKEGALSFLHQLLTHSRGISACTRRSGELDQDGAEQQLSRGSGVWIADWETGESDSEDPGAGRLWLVSLAAEPVWCRRLLGLLCGSETSHGAFMWFTLVGVVAAAGTF